MRFNRRGSTPLITSTLCVLFSIALLTVAAGVSSQSSQQVAERSSGNNTDTRQQAALRKLVSRAGIADVALDRDGNEGRTHRKLILQWIDHSKNGNAASALLKDIAPAASVLDEDGDLGPLPRRRSLELSSTLLFIAAVDKNNRLTWWSIEPDPRIIRAEFPNDAGELQGDVRYASKAELIIPFPDDPKIVSLRVFHPVWNGNDFDLQLLATVTVP